MSSHEQVAGEEVFLGTVVGVVFQTQQGGTTSEADFFEEEILGGGVGTQGPLDFVREGGEGGGEIV